MIDAPNKTIMLEKLPPPDIPAFPIEAGHIMMFARAIGDPNPIYNDEAYAARSPLGGIIAPPTFVEASIHHQRNFAFRPRIGEPWFGSGATPSGVPLEQAESGANVHASTHFRYYGPLRPGTVLTTRHRAGRRWEKQGRRSGKLFFFESSLDFIGPDGRVLVTSTTVGVSTERKIEQPIKDETQPRTILALDLQPSYPVIPPSAAELSAGVRNSAVVASNLTRSQIIQYAGASGDFSPQHTDEVYNTQVAGYPTVFAHGMLTMAMTGRMLTDWLGDDALLSYSFEFRAQVWPGDSLIAEAIVQRVEQGDEGPVAALGITTRNDRGTVVGIGEAMARLRR